jgi:hypothetical protein
VTLESAVRTLHRRQWLPRPLEAVFDFFEHPENLALITPPWLGLRLRTPGPLTMRAGLVIDYRVRVLASGWAAMPLVVRARVLARGATRLAADAEALAAELRGADGQREGEVWSAEIPTLAYLCALPPVSGRVPGPRPPRADDPVADTFGFGDRAIR